MEAGNNKIYDGQFRGNILVAGKTGCGKTHFLPKLKRKLIKTEWVKVIHIDKRREAEIQSCFDNEV